MLAYIVVRRKRCAILPEFSGSKKHISYAPSKVVDCAIIEISPAKSHIFSRIYHKDAER